RPLSSRLSFPAALRIPAIATSVPEPFFQRLVVAPGDDPSAIPLPVEDAHLIEIDRTGALLVHNGDRVRRQQQPRAYQDIDGRRKIGRAHVELQSLTNLV